MESNYLTDSRYRTAVIGITVLSSALFSAIAFWPTFQPGEPAHQVCSFVKCANDGSARTYRLPLPTADSITDIPVLCFGEDTDAGDHIWTTWCIKSSICRFEER